MRVFNKSVLLNNAFEHFDNHPFSVRKIPQNHDIYLHNCPGSNTLLTPWSTENSVNHEHGTIITPLAKIASIMSVLQRMNGNI